MSALRSPALGARPQAPRVLWQAWVVLAKLPIALASALTAILGYRMAGAAWDRGAWLLGLATLLLAMGAGALNQLQERDLDSRMLRTRKRPLVSGTLSTADAGIASALLLATGLGGLLVLGPGPTLAGLLTLLLYNAIYTPLKRWSLWAVLPGAFVGAIPPAMGWMAAGRSPWETPLLALGLLLFVWQLPHFWTLLLIHREDYARAGFRGLLTPRSAARLAHGGLVALVAVSALAPRTGLIATPACRAALACSGLALLWAGHWLHGQPRRTFLGINLYALITLGLMLLDAGVR